MISAVFSSASTLLYTIRDALDLLCGCIGIITLLVCALDVCAKAQALVRWWDAQLSWPPMVIVSWVFLYRAFADLYKHAFIVPWTDALFAAAATTLCIFVAVSLLIEGLE